MTTSAPSETGHPAPSHPGPSHSESSHSESSRPESSLPFTAATEAAASWVNEPKSWRFDDGALVVAVDPRTDFWRHTHYGFVRDNGHLLAVREPGDFVASVEVDAAYRDRYDQAGLMIRLDEQHWIKAGIELDGSFHMSTVVTNERSDWSVTPLPGRPDLLRLRVTRTGDAVTVEYQAVPAPDGGIPDGGQAWVMHRLAWFPAGEPVLVGPMAAAPDGTGFEARFRNWHVER